MQEGFAHAGDYVLEGCVDDVWDLLFSDAPRVVRWDSVKASFEHKLKELSDWFEPKQETYRGLPVLAERKVIYESKFDGYIEKALAAHIYFELQKTFLLRKAEN